MCRYWWGSTLETRKIHWMSWKKMYRTKEMGGMGFRDLHIFNLTLLAKQGWQILQNPDSLLARILKAKYFPNSNLLDAFMGNNPSYTWRSIIEGREVLKLGVLWRVGWGDEINIWIDPWIPTAPDFMPTLLEVMDLTYEKVSQLINVDSRNWNEHLVDLFFTLPDAERIKQIRLNEQPMSDSWFWIHDLRGEFRVKSAYKVAWNLANAGLVSNYGAQVLKLMKIMWKLQVPPRIRVFAWRVINDILPTKQHLQDKVISMPGGCFCCGYDQESIEHLLL